MITLLFHYLDDEIIVKGLGKFMMISHEVLMLSVALAIDAAIVSFAYGLMVLGMSKRVKVRRGGLIAFSFGFFQFLMLWLGSFLGHLFSFSSVGYLFQFLVAGIFIVIAIKCLQESMVKEERKFEWGLMPLLVLAFVTSIDAAASGVSFGTLPFAYEIAFTVGVITTFVCGLFFASSHFFEKIPHRWLLRLASALFSFLGGQIIYEYIF